MCGSTAEFACERHNFTRLFRQHHVRQTPYEIGLDARPGAILETIVDVPNAGRGIAAAPMTLTPADRPLAPQTAREAAAPRPALLPVLLRPLYRWYERRLVLALRDHVLPRHIGIILDGNRRHARALGISDPREVYGLGAHKLDDVLAWCDDLRIPTVTLWVFSPENLRRSTAEVSGIFGAIEAKLLTLAQDARIHEGRVRVRAIGKLDLVPDRTRAAIRLAEEATAGYDGMVLNIAVAYGGRQEIIDAVAAFLADNQAEGRTLAEIIPELTPKALGRYLYTAGLPDPDLIIRTSGEVRLSGFMLWQSAHSEFYFTDVNWPAFRKIDFLRAIRTFQQRQRRFGL
jgi:short-chain Z-isoprenyl diphosphate synthase